MANDDSYQVFKCPSCGQYISNRSDTCRFCASLITDEMKAQAIEQESDENRKYRFKSSKTILYTGIGIFAIGTALLLVGLIPILLTGNGYVFFWSPIIMLFGIGQTIIGLLGMLEERKRRK